MPASRPSSPPRNPTTRDLESFYAQYHTRVRRAVAVSVHTTDDTVIDDAVAFGWLQLVRRTDVTLDDRGAAWLITVAIREGWRLTRTPREVPSGPFRGASDGVDLEVPEPATLDGDPEALTLNHDAHDQRAADFQKLKPVERRELYLHALGFSYEQIAEATGSSYSAVNRRISAGRAKLARLARIRADRQG
jgi:DNA-directed RNA polymerase specialized sigma24 family protein